MEKIFIDSLTKINNEDYLIENYDEFINENPNSNFVMIDFEHFKNINDTYGHNIGDIYLKLFANILTYCFRDSIVVRLHGDEFAILTSNSEDTISKLFDICNEKISLATIEEKIPKVFRFNAGSAKASTSLEETKRKADYIMYHAKKNQITYQKYSSDIYNEKVLEDTFLNKVKLSLKEDDFSYTKRELYDINKEKLDIYQLYTKERNGSSIFDEGRYDILKNSSKLQELDLYNIENLLNKKEENNGKMIIIIDYNSLISNRILVEYLILHKNLLNNFILSIDLSGLDSKSYPLIIRTINELKENNISVLLDKFDSNICDAIWENSNIDYIKICNSYWKKAMVNSKIYYSLAFKVQAFRNCGIKIVFDYVEKEEEYEFLRSLASYDTLFSGNYFSLEKQLILKKKI
jgi:diguanylate cyclase (GGDEF)-like protein